MASACRLDERVDVWSLGCLLYFAMHGVSPFERARRVPTPYSRLLPLRAPDELAYTVQHQIEHMHFTQKVCRGAR